VVIILEGNVVGWLQQQSHSNNATYAANSGKWVARPSRFARYRSRVWTGIFADAARLLELLTLYLPSTFPTGYR